MDLAIFTKTLHQDVWEGPKYVSDSSIEGVQFYSLHLISLNKSATELIIE